MKWEAADDDSTHDMLGGCAVLGGAETRRLTAIWLSEGKKEEVRKMN